MNARRLQVPQPGEPLVSEEERAWFITLPPSEQLAQLRALRAQAPDFQTQRPTQPETPTV